MIFSERHPPVDASRQLHISQAVVADDFVFPGGEYFSDARAVHPVGFRSLEAEDARQAVKADLRAVAPPLPLTHRVEERLVAVARERQFAGRLDAVNDRPLVNELQVEVEKVVPDDPVDVGPELDHHFPELGQHLALVASKLLAEVVPPETPASDSAAPVIVREANAENSSEVAREGGARVLVPGLPAIPSLA